MPQLGDSIVVFPTYNSAAITNNSRGSSIELVITKEKSTCFYHQTTTSRSWPCHSLALFRILPPTLDARDIIEVPLRGALASQIIIVVGLGVDDLGDNGALDAVELVVVAAAVVTASSDALQLRVADVLLAAELDVGAVVPRGAAQRVHKGALRLARRAVALLVVPPVRRVRALAALVVRRPHHLADQLGHVHLDVELGHVGKGLEVEVSACVENIVSQSVG